MTDPDEFARQHVAAFNDAVTAGDFTAFLAGFADDAVIAFENVPGAGRLEFAGRDAYTAAYAQQPPDDQISQAGPPQAGPAQAGDGTVIVPFAWRADGSPGTMRVARDGDLITAMTVIFG
jgi:hypothetical protein